MSKTKQDLQGIIGRTFRTKAKVEKPRRRPLAFEALESKALLSTSQSIDDVGVDQPAELGQEIPIDVVTAPGDSNGDGQFNQLDIVHVFQAGKYLTGEVASWSEGDWDNDGYFSQLDIIAALSWGHYRPGNSPAKNAHDVSAANPALEAAANSLPRMSIRARVDDAAVAAFVDSVNSTLVNTGSAVPQDTGAQDAKYREIQELIDKLGNDDPEVREQATAELIRRGLADKDVFEKVQEAKDNTDPEIQGRAARIVDEIEKTLQEEEIDRLGDELTGLRTEQQDHGDAATEYQKEGELAGKSAEQYEKAGNTDKAKEQAARAGKAYENAADETADKRQAHRDEREAESDLDEAEKDQQGTHREERSQRAKDRAKRAEDRAKQAEDRAK